MSAATTDSTVSEMSLFTTKLLEDISVIESSIKRDLTTQTVDAIIRDAAGKTVFEKRGVVAPSSWSQLSINIAAEKYFIKTGEGAENSVSEMCLRLARNISMFGTDNGYIVSPSHEVAFQQVLKELLENQYFSFNSPVWFNVGNSDGNSPQISACFILGIQDTMESILETAVTEGMIYKKGSGSGINYSPLRGAGEPLSKGGVSSGVTSFLKMHDGVAGSIRSGGTTRRAAKMALLNADHPDIEDFISCKSREEAKAVALIAAGFNADYRDPNGAYGSIAFQNANHSVRVTDEFMEAVRDDKDWVLYGNNEAAWKALKARDLFNQIADAAWRSGDPGLQFIDTINFWNTLKEDGTINASNPCSEYLSLDNTSCNLASINLMKFYDQETSTFNLDLYKSVCRFVTICLDILISAASYPTELISYNVKQYRQIGLGYANLGSLFMAKGLAYNSNEAREFATVLTSAMTAYSYEASAYLASALGAFPAYMRNKDHVCDVLSSHTMDVDGNDDLTNLWFEVRILQDTYGIRNSYVTNIAPTGTIGLVMGCDTTGIEPELGLVKYKTLVGGGTEKIVNNTVRAGLKKLGYAAPEIEEIVGYIAENSTAEGAPYLKVTDLPVFDCSFKVKGANRAIPWQAHVEMLAAVQPHLSGGISKTVNMPSDATVDDVKQAYTMAWEKGVKCIAIYRDGCKDSQPLNLGKGKSSTFAVPPIEKISRTKLPDERKSITHKFNISGHEGYIHVGLYPNDTPGEIFVTISKEGTFVSGLLDSWATMFSIALQHGAPLELLVNKLRGHTYDPQGITANPDIRIAKSITDYISRWLALKFLGDSPVAVPKSINNGNGNGHKAPAIKDLKDNSWGGICDSCQGPTMQSGTCHVCMSCGSTSGCS